MIGAPTGFRSDSLGHLSEVKISIALLALTALVAGCGGSDDPPDPPQTQATETPSQAAPTPMATIDAEGDRATVKAVQLTLEDLPSGWQDSGNDDANRSKCPGAESARETATATGDSPQFTASETTSVESATYLYTDEAAATKAFESVASDETRQCIADELISHLDEPANGVKIGEPVPERVGATALGDDADAGRITIPLSRGETKTGIVADLAFVRVGRGLVLMTYANLAKPLPDALRAELTGKVTDRLTTELK